MFFLVSPFSKTAFTPAAERKPTEETEQKPNQPGPNPRKRKGTELTRNTDTTLRPRTTVWRKTAQGRTQYQPRMEPLTPLSSTTDKDPQLPSTSGYNPQAQEPSTTPLEASIGHIYPETENLQTLSPNLFDNFTELEEMSTRLLTQEDIQQFQDNSSPSMKIHIG